ncbi:MAG: DUF805 domain-containing protein [Desulfovibrio sp.]|uniref:DUF805 domain-containing protein n=1 Tax=Desulfovibrio sp. TaxID=885 RepID=UPI002A90E23E|nr:DUF805 domain-containing protein [Desulfovibrio sp.]MCI6333041.1 DUF805 domain-containing protein [Desulfovibrio piger]MDY6234671.1 DUF805 domain-containing protein [Desulfovibrio sp.]
MNSAQSMSPNLPMLGFQESVVRCLRKYATFRGRATRAEYWWFSLFNTLLGMVVYAAVQHLMGTEAADGAASIVQLALFLPMLAVGVRRLHDIDFRGWWMLLGLTVVGIIPLIIFFCLPGKQAPNRFGTREYGAQTGMTPEQQAALVPQAGPAMQAASVTEVAPEQQMATAVRTTPTTQPEAVAPPATEKPAEKDYTRLTSLLLCLCCLAGLGLAAPSAGTASDTETSSSPSSGQGMEQGIQEAFGGLISVMGEAIGGMTRGMQEGARDIQAQLDGSDGTRVISSGKDLASLTETRVLKAEQLEDRSWRITLAVRNPQEFPVRLAGLTDKRQVLLLDQEDFVHEPGSVGERLVTVPERAAQKLTFLFPELDGSTPRTLRLYGMDLPVPQAAGTGNVSP